MNVMKGGFSGESEVDSSPGTSEEIGELWAERKEWGGMDGGSSVHEWKASLKIWAQNVSWIEYDQVRVLVSLCYNYGGFVCFIERQNNTFKLQTQNCRERKTCCQQPFSGDTMWGLTILSQTRTNNNCHSINRFDSAFGFNPSRLLSCGAAFSGVTALIMIAWGYLLIPGRTHVFNSILAATPCEALQYPLRLRRITIYQSINQFDSAFGFNPWSLPSCRAPFSGVTALMMIAWGR